MLRDIAGAIVIDADLVAHRVMREDAEARDAVVAAFGSVVLDADGYVDRSRLGRIVFSDPRRLQQLERIVHPAVRHAIRAQLATLPQDATVVVDAVKLLDGDLGSLMHSVWWVTARPDQQLERLVGIRGLSEEEARLRLAVQPSLERYRSRVHAIIDNSGSIAETRNQVCRVLNNARAVQDPPAPSQADS
jgi:dephospho-CoA kinase